MILKKLYECFVNFLVVMVESCYNRENEKNTLEKKVQGDHQYKRERFI